MPKTASLILLAAFAAGLAWGQGDGDLLQKLKGVKREVKVIEFEDAVARVPGIVKREEEHHDLVKKMAAGVAAGEDITPLIEKGRDLKLAQLKELNEILKLHNGKARGLDEKEVWNRLIHARFEHVHYDREWLVNILDDLEEKIGINIEVDARIYKFDTVTFDFEKTSGRAMLQMMGDALLYKWIVRGDTLYVYKERHEILFGGEWLRKKRAAWKARKEALDKAMKEAEKRAAEGDK